MTDTPVLLIGGTRGTGLLIARLLVQQHQAVRILARDPTRAARTVPHTAKILRGDITDASTLDPAVTSVRDIIFTAGCRSGRPVSERQVRRTEYEGVVNTLAAAKRHAFTGRFLYMTASGIGARSFWSFALNIYKGNTLLWRERAERVIRDSQVAYTIIRTGVLMNGPSGAHSIRLTQQPLPLTPRYRISRSDVAAGFVAAMEDPRTVCSTFEIIWGEKGGRSNWSDLFATIRPDHALCR